jgi:divalent metal cation (Fe/Co/Zn/Cd) transporter
MIARGFSGEACVLDEFHARVPDVVTLLSAFIALMGTIWLNQFFR